MCEVFALKQVLIWLLKAQYHTIMDFAVTEYEVILD